MHGSPLSIESESRSEPMSSTLDIRPVRAGDAAAITDLHKAAFGPGRFTRTAYRIREGTPLATPHCRVALLGRRLVAALRFTAITIGGQGGALLLGPIAVDPADRGKGHGQALIAKSLADAAAAGVRLVLLVGDMPYYGRFGFKPVAPGQILLPGPVNPARLLALELEAGVLSAYRGLVAAG